jgi:hypothetical protein
VRAVSFDVILCGNVMIYVDKPAQEALAGRFYICLVKGGYMLYHYDCPQEDGAFLLSTLWGNTHEWVGSSTNI